LGETGRNFAAGMSGGVAYVLDETGRFSKLVNLEMVELDDLDDHDRKYIHKMVTKHVQYTGSVPGQRVLNDWNTMIGKFVKVMPVDYKRALAELSKAERQKAERELQAVSG
jgi:glutamate synthase (NADPH/NADH) large chain